MHNHVGKGQFVPGQGRTWFLAPAGAAPSPRGSKRTGGRLGGGWRRGAKGLNLPSTALLSRQRISARTKRFWGGRLRAGLSPWIHGYLAVCH